MKNKKTLIVIILLLCLIIIGCLYFWILPAMHAHECKNRVYLELKDKADDIKKSVVGIIPENKNENGASHNGIGSGVIFRRNGNTYYVVTAAHVVEKNSLYKIFTINTAFSGKVVEVDDNVNFQIPDDNYYDSLLNSKIEYISENIDLAILSFESDEELPVMEFETNKLQVGDKVIAIGHPEGNRYMVTYGTIKSDIKSVTIGTKGTDKKKKDKIVEHDAYLNFGSSGGVLISKNMKIAGINIGGAFSLFGYFDKGFMIPSDIVQNVIDAWNSVNNNNETNIDTIQTSNSWNKDNVTMKVLEVLDNNTSATLEINDKNDNPISWETEFSIQKMSDGDNNWYDLISKVKFGGARNLVSPDEHGITTMKIDWSSMYGSLKNGTYRIVKHKDFTTLYSEPFSI